MTYAGKYAQAVLALVPDAKFGTAGNDADTIQIVGWDSETSEQPTDAAIKTKLAELETADNNQQAQRANNQKSGNKKLLDLGLTQAEVTALTGYKPPAE